MQIPEGFLGDTPEWWEKHRVRWTIPMKVIWEDMKQRLEGVKELQDIAPVSMRVRKGELVIDVERRFE